MNAHARSRQERGIAIVLLALSMVFLLIMTAFVVDLGAAYVEKRDDQNAADAGALAGAIELAFVTQGSVAQDIVDEVMASVEGTVGPISNAEWANPANCPGEPPSGFTAIGSMGLGAVSPATTCISVNKVYDTIRVRVPVRTVATAFATVIGIDSIDVSAAAAATIELPTPLLLPPFAAPAGVSGGDSICLSTSGGPENRTPGEETTQGNVMWSNLPPLPYDVDGDGNVTATDPDQADPCDNDSTALGSGQFGTLLPYSYVHRPCTQDNAVIEVAIAEGVDHLLSRYPAPFYDPADTRVDGARCNGQVGPPFPNAMAVNTGFSSASMVTCGLMGQARSGCDGNGPALPTGEIVTGRLRGGSFATGSLSTQWGDRPIDGVAPWYFLLPTNTGSCNPSGYTGTFEAKWTRFQACLNGWTSGQGTIFSIDIAQSSRFSFIPLVAQRDFPSAGSCSSYGGVGSNGMTCVQFEEFVPIFFHRLYGVATGNSGGATCVLAPADSSNGNRRPLAQTVGDGTGASTNPCGRNYTLVHRMAGLVLDCRMLPGDLCSTRPGETPPPGGDIVFDIYLTD